MKNINIANDFSRYPAGRTRIDGPDNGERFRKELLLPRLQDAIKNRGILIVVLDGARSYGSSFLEEAFGGLVRCEGIQKADIKKHLKIEAHDAPYVPYRDLILKYIKEAIPK